MNGHAPAKVNGSSKKAASEDGEVWTKAWAALAKVLPSRDPDMDFWWQLTGRHLAALLDAAAYPIDTQYEALLVHYHWTSTRMGPSPRPGGRAATKWRSMLQIDGTPNEYSWKWNTATGAPDVRYTVEPIGEHAGTQLDPLNMAATRELLHGMAERLPGVDLGWTHHLIASLFDHDNGKYSQEIAAGAKYTSTLLIAVELLRGEVALKTYFQPRRLGQSDGIMAVSGWEQGIASLDPSNEARTLLHDFMTHNPEGKLLAPFSLSVDNVAPEQAARLKWYFNSPHTNFNAIREIMTLGGRVASTPQLEKQFEGMRSLIQAVCGLDADFPLDQEIPLAPSSLLDASGVQGAREGYADIEKLLVGVVYFFDVAPGKKFPGIKFYIPVRNHGRDDAAVARGITGWMEKHGRGQYCAAYLEALTKIAEHRRLDEARGMQTFVSCQFKSNGDLDITSYMAPEAFHPARLEKRRATRRRGDD